jgi:hypothetical protein
MLVTRSEASELPLDVVALALVRNPDGSVDPAPRMAPSAPNLAMLLLVDLRRRPSRLSAA